MNLYARIFILILVILYICGCSKNNLPISASPEDFSVSKQNSNDEALKQACIKAAICGIGLEIKRHQNWIEQSKGKPGDDSEMQERLSQLNINLEKFKNIKLEDYEIPKKLQVKAWVDSLVSENSILYVEGMTKSGPWYQICGIKGDDYTAIKPEDKYLMTIYLVYPRYYWNMESYYIYIGEYK